MRRGRWRLREATALSSEAPLARGGAAPVGGGESGAAADPPAGTSACPKCTGGVMPDGSQCSTCDGSGRVGTLAESERITQLEGLLAATTQRLREASPEHLSPTFGPVQNATGGYEVVLIREGKGNSEDGRWYTRDCIQELVGSGACEGMQAYSDHPSLDEEDFLPERSVKELIGSYRNVRFAESNGRAEARATFVPINGDGFEWVNTLAETAARQKESERPLVGISLYGAAAGDDRKRPDGSFGPVADLIRPTSGDLVTNAGAGGGFVRTLMESEHRRRREALFNDTKGRPMKLAEHMAKVKGCAAKLREAGTDESKLKDGLAELEQLAGAEVEPEQAPIDGLKVEQLKESEPLWAKIRESIQPAASAAEADAQLKAENQRLKDEKAAIEGELREAQSTIKTTNSSLVGMKVLREAKVPAEDAEMFLSLFRESGATTEEAMKGLIEREQEREERIVQRVRESSGLGFVEGMPGAAGQSSADLIDLSADGIPQKEPAAA